MWQIAFQFFGWLLFAFWASLLIPTWFVVHNWRLRRMAAGMSPPDKWPRVSILVPARNEGVQIEAALKSLLVIDYPDLEIIAIDDRSTDRTGEVMDQLGATDPRLRVTHVTDLPDGWLGKNHAMHIGAAQATGEWLLFTDGDVIFAPDALKISVTYVERAKFDHLALNPHIIPGGYWENALTCCFGLIFFAHLRPWRIPTPDPRAYCGIGAFNLVRMSAYQTIGGHEKIRLDVLDDLHLGKLLKQAGFRQQLLIGGDLLRVRWQDSLWGVVRGLEKNSFAATHYSVLELVIVTAILAIVLYVPYLGAAFLPLVAGLPFWLSLVLLHTTYAYLAARLGGKFLLLPALPIAAALLIFTMWRSAIITLRNGGIRWRETFYPLKELREHQLR